MENSIHQTQQMYQLTIAISQLNDGQSNDPQAITAFQNLFDLMLWAEKRQEQVFQSILDDLLLCDLVAKYPNRILNLLSGMTMLLGNAKEDGKLIQYLLQSRVPNKVLKDYLVWLQSAKDIEEDELLHLVGSMLKAYHRHFKANTYKYYIQEDHCLLIEICCKFYNCPEQITRTSVMNILMTLLKLPFIDQVLSIKSIGVKVSHWCRDMCRLFRNQLKDFDQHLMVTDQSESQFIIHSINDKIILWEDLSVLTPHLFASHFYQQIILPLIIGSLNTKQIPLFTLKFALFVVNKLIPTISKLNLLTDLGMLLFEKREIFYQDQQLNTAILRPFSIRKLLKEDILTQEDEEQPNSFQNLNLLFLNILKSKDGRFLECACILLVNLLAAVKLSPKVAKLFISRLGFGLRGSAVTQISNIIMTHFTVNHTLQITKVIAALLIYIQPSMYIDDEQKNRFAHIYKNIVGETLQTIQKHHQVHPYLAQILQYDIKALSSDFFSLSPVSKTDSALLFNNEIIQNDSLPFYFQIPQTRNHIARYQVVKSLLLRKLSQKLIEQCSNQPPLQKYYENIRAKSNNIRPGDYLSLPLTVKDYRCKMIDGKFELPNCLLIQDNQSVIVGYLQHNQVRIITNFKFKHIKTEIQVKKQKLNVNMQMRRYNNNLQQIQQIKGFCLKSLQMPQNYFNNKRNQVILQEINILVDLLRRSRKIIPEVSLI